MNKVYPPPAGRRFTGVHSKARFLQNNVRELLNNCSILLNNHAYLELETPGLLSHYNPYYKQHNIK